METSEPPRYEALPLSLLTFFDDGESVNERSIEDLPSYEPYSVPLYEESYVEPVVSYVWQQVNRKRRIIKPILSCDQFPSYSITARTGPNIFSKKSDFTLERTQPKFSRHGSTESWSSSERTSEAVIATLNFLNVSRTPWMPHALMNYSPSPLATKTYYLAAPNFSDFNIVIDGKQLTWRLSSHPLICLILVDQDTDNIIARFSYSCYGTEATNGSAVGVLDIFDLEPGEAGDCMREVAIGTCELVCQHHRKMGRRYRNYVKSGEGIT